MRTTIAKFLLFGAICLTNLGTASCQRNKELPLKKVNLVKRI